MRLNFVTDYPSTHKGVFKNKLLKWRQNFSFSSLNEFLEETTTNNFPNATYKALYTRLLVNQFIFDLHYYYICKFSFIVCVQEFNNTIYLQIRQIEGAKLK